MFKRIFVILFCLLLVVGVIAGIKVLQVRKMIAASQHKSFPPAIVTTAKVKAETWQTTLTAVGSLVAVQGVTVAAELAGKVVEIAFTAGTSVDKGDLLVHLDTTSEQAQLSAAETAVTLARINRDRARELVRKKSVSRSSQDTTEAQYNEALAKVKEIRAVIEKKIIRAPFSGRLGIREVNLGQILSQGDPIVELQSLDPIFVNFSLPQQELARLATGLKVQVTTDVLPGKPVAGTLTAINPGVDVATRNVKIQATLKNIDEKLRPGMFVRVAVQLPDMNEVLIIPNTSILYAPYGDSVFVLDEFKDDKTGKAGMVLRKQVVRTGIKRGDFVTITSGLKAGETVVTTGVFKFRNKQPAIVDNRLAPDFTEHPELENR
jgi:membrane fusion protein (multidrug efflux system)